MREKRCGAMISVTFSLFILVTLMPSSTAGYKTIFFRPEKDTPKFNRLVVDHNSGRVYVGATNWLYQLSPDLQLEVAERTGPYEDSPECPVSQDCPTINTKLTNNTNKVLVIDYKKGRLISCGSLFQGLCHVHNLHDVSDNEQVPNEAVAANDDAASTVAFIAPGPPNPLTSDVLYVGVSFTTNGPYRMDVPAISSRSLDPDKMLDLASGSRASGTRIFVNSLSRERYPINYVYGFASGGYSYFLTIQKKLIDTPYLFESKLIRICHRDPDYYSYTEIPIECKSEDGSDHFDYNLVQAAYLGKAGSKLAEDLGVTSQEDVLYAVFAQNKNGCDVNKKSSGRSALCVYSMSAIHRKFTQNIQHCFSGNGERGLDFITPSIKCSQTQLAIDDEFCGLDINTPLGGQLPIVAHPAITFNFTILTAVAAAPVHDFTATFLGTSTGHILKVVLETSKNAFLDDVMEGQFSPIYPNLVLDHDMAHIYSMTEQMVVKMKLHRGEIYQSCSRCISSGNRFLGWCTLENKCTFRSDCQQASQDPAYWQTYRNAWCTIITSVKPFALQRTTEGILNITVENLPEAPSGIECVFTTPSVSLRTNAVNNSGEIGCPTPRTADLPHIPEGQHYFTSNFSIQERNGSELAVIPFKFFDCATYTSCIQCVRSRFPCNWCITGHRCTHDTSDNCRNDFLVTGVWNDGPLTTRYGPRFCPQIGWPARTPTRIFVPNGSNQELTVEVQNVEVFTTDLPVPFTCQFSAEGTVKRVSAQLLGDTIHCNVTEFNYTSNVSMINVTFDVIWIGDEPLDNTRNIHVVVYNCSDVAYDCQLCVILPEKERCSWCKDSPRCQVTKRPNRRRGYRTSQRDSV